MERLAWHPAFVQAIQLEFADYLDVLEFISEHPLTSEPLKIDVLIIKKRTDAEIKKSIGRIFQAHNIVEYKSPEDRLTIWDYHKVQCYSRLYAVLNKVDLADISVTAIVFRKPKKLFRQLRERFEIESIGGGIYYVKGDTCLTQIIVTDELSESESVAIQALRSGLTAVRLGTVIDAAESKKTVLPFDAFMNIVLNANPLALKDIKEMRRTRPTLEDVLTEMGYTAQWEAQGIAIGEARGEARGEVRGKQDAILVVLRGRFKKIPKSIETAIRQINDPIVLDSYAVEAAVCASVKDFEQALSNCRL